MNTIFQEFNSSMDNIHNTFFISFLALKPFSDGGFIEDYKIPINDFSYNTIEMEQLNKLGNDSLVELVNAIRRHTLNDLVICYERYATLMYMSHMNGMTRQEPALSSDRSINSSSLESLSGLYTSEEKSFFVQLRRLRNSIVHFNGTYCKTNELDCTFGSNRYQSKGAEGSPISVDLDTIVWLFSEVRKKVSDVDKRYYTVKP